MAKLEVLMFSFLSFILRILFNLFKSKRQLLTRISILEKELEIYKRKQVNKRLKIKQIDRIIFSLLNKILNIKDKISIVKPETLLKWQNQLIKSFWTFKSKKASKGRPPNRINLINKIEAVTFEEAWKNKTEEKILIDEIEYKLNFIGLNQLIKNKTSLNRNKDIEDLKFLQAVKNKNDNE